MIPSGPVTLLSMAVVWAVGLAMLVYGDRSAKLIGAAFLISWISARAATELDNISVAVIGWTVCFFMTLSSITVVSRLIAMLYAARVIWSSALAFGAVGWVIFWDVNRVMLYAQLLLAFGEIGRGTLDRVNRNRRAAGRPNIAVPGLSARRVCSGSD
jgi:hypothetical protein